MASGEAELKEMIVSTTGSVGKDGNGSSFSNKYRTDPTQHTSCASVGVVHVHVACGKKPMYYVYMMD